MDNYEDKLSREVEKQIERDKKAARLEEERDRDSYPIAQAAQDGVPQDAQDKNNISHTTTAHQPAQQDITGSTSTNISNAATHGSNTTSAATHSSNATIQLDRKRKDGDDHNAPPLRTKAARLPESTRTGSSKRKADGSPEDSIEPKAANVSVAADPRLV